MYRLLHLIVLVLLTSFLLSAQGWPDGARWIYVQDDFIPDGIDEYREFLKTGDTLILGRSCAVISESLTIVRDGDVRRSFFQDFYLHYSDRKIDVYDPSDEQFHDLYDFTLVAGDTLRSYCMYGRDYTYVIIDSVTSLIIDEVEYAVQHITSLYLSSCDMNGTIIEKIGSDKYLFPRFGAADPAPGGFLRCYNDDELNYPEDMVCEITVSTSNPDALSFSASPNPVLDELVVSGARFESAEIYDMRGVLQRSIDLLESSTESATIDMSGLVPGIYVIRVFDGDAYGFQKILKVGG